MMILRETFADVCNDNTADCIPESQIKKNFQIFIFNDYWDPPPPTIFALLNP